MLCCCQYAKICIDCAWEKGKCESDFCLDRPQRRSPTIHHPGGCVVVLCYNVVFLLVSYKKYKWDQTLQPANHPSLKSCPSTPTSPTIKIDVEMNEQQKPGGHRVENSSGCSTGSYVKGGEHWLHPGKPVMNHSSGKHLHTWSSLIKKKKKTPKKDCPAWKLHNNKSQASRKYYIQQPRCPNLLEFDLALLLLLDCQSCVFLPSCCWFSVFVIASTSTNYFKLREK